MIVAFLDRLARKQRAIRLFAHRLGARYQSSYDPVPPDTSLIITYGVLRGMADRINEAIDRKIPWMYMDNGYLGKRQRITTNCTAPTTFREGRRFEHNTKLEKWRGGEGNHILVLPPSYPYINAFKCGDFLNHVVHNVNRYTGRDVIVRGKPMTNEPDKLKHARPLQEQLEGAYAVITWGSAATLDALRLGIPTISLGWCPGKMASFNMEDLETDRLLDEPDRMAVFDNLTWCSFDREELSIACDIVIENAKAKPIIVE